MLIQGYASGNTFTAAAGDEVEVIAITTTQFRLVIFPTAGTPVVGTSVPRSYLAGLTLSTAGASATMTTAAGQATDGGNTAVLTLAAAMGKTTSAWAVGTGNGGLDTGAIANSTWYHFWLIQRPDTGVVDVLISLSATAPMMPASYTLKRRIGSGFTNGSAQWTSFTQQNDEFWWSTPPALDLNAVGSTANRTLTAMTVPTGVIVKWIGNMSVLAGASGAQRVLLTDPANADIAPSVTASPESTIGFNGAASTTISAQCSVWTNTSAQIGVRVSQATDALQIQTIAWIDRRGRDA
jgi:hypothetical protein